ncbi:MAG: response regulator [Alphaproteobacteria bacterium]
MARVTFTDDVLQVQPPSRGQIDLWDESFPGFGLRISQGGTRAWVVMVRRDRRKVRVTLGTYPEMPVETARGLARSLLDESRRQHGTPRRGRVPRAMRSADSRHAPAEYAVDPAAAGLLPVSSAEFRRTAARLIQLMGELLRPDMAPPERDALDRLIQAGAHMAPTPPGLAKASPTLPSESHAPVATADVTTPIHKPPSAQKPRLLLVEDTELNRLVTLAMLGTARFDIDCVTSGEAALASAQEILYDVILMDISMPEMDGIAATRAIRSLAPPVCDVPILALTAHAMVGDRERCLAAGVDDYLPKPVSRSDLLERVERFARHGRAAAADITGASDEPALNPEAFEQLRRDLGPASLMQLYDATLPELQTRTAAAKAANEARDLDALARIAHSLKGVATTIGARRLQAATTALEAAARSGSTHEIARLLESLDALSEKTIRAIAAERSRIS